MTKDIIITYNDETKALHVTAHSINMLKALARTAGLESLMITSTLRTPQSQAAAMYYNVTNTGYDKQLELYGPIGKAVLNAALDLEKSLAKDISEDEKARVLTAAMVDEINRQYPNRVSRHVVPAEEYAKLNVIDIGYDSVPDKDAFRAILNDAHERQFIKFIDEPYNECFHVEIAADADLYNR